MVAVVVDILNDSFKRVHLVQFNEVLCPSCTEGHRRHILRQYFQPKSENLGQIFSMAPVDLLVTHLALSGARRQKAEPSF